MKTRTTLIAALTAVTLAGCASSTQPAVHDSTAGPAAETSAPTAAPVAQPAAHGVEAAIETIPWSRVGPGWMLATWSPVSGTSPGEERPPNEPSRDTAITTLYLVNPEGGRYKIADFPPPGEAAGFELADWSGDGGKALFRSGYSQEPSQAILVDLHTGKQNRLTVDGSPRFTRPDGKALLVGRVGQGSKPSSLERVNLDGGPQLTYPTDKLESEFNGRYLSTPDGTRLVLGTSAGLSLMGNNGTVGAPISVPGEKDCEPLRWWDGKPGTTVLARCASSEVEYTSSLWLVPIDGGTPTALTAPNDGQNGPDIGDVNAWQLPAGTFVQALGGCGVVYVAKLNADGTTDEGVSARGRQRQEHRGARR